VSNHAGRSMFDEVKDTSILKTGHLVRYQRSLPWGQRSGEATAATIAKRFSGVLGMLSSLEVKVLRST
jgi:hypothetical protein